MIEYVDYAIDLLTQEKESDSSLRLSTELAELGCKKIIKVPTFANGSIKIEMSLSFKSHMVDKIGNIEEITAYTHYLAMKGQSIGLTIIDGHKPTSEEIETKSRICSL